ncbi:MAG: DNA gyrase subunit A [Pygmaiobacter massiliensis]|nr:DNA gyrase subunit A [Pygmaiobacter massiliensis]
MQEEYIMTPGSGTKVIVRDVQKEIETAFLDYSMSVIVSRALPDVRDGLKPVHRRILYTMHERGNDPSHPYRKSADTVGAVLGSYHPHGDASVYDAMVRLAQDFSLRYPLVDGQGNFGSVDGDPAAAYRYTEARMSKIATEMLTDIDKETIDWAPNFDETKKEPSVLPSRFPNLLVNGSQGIAVGMATNIPPHNLQEVVDGCVALIDHPDLELAGLMEYIKGPDFPTAGIIMGRSGIRAAYATGRGKITLRGRAEIVEKPNGKSEIIITEIPYMVNKARMISDIAERVKNKQIDGIADIVDETNRKGMRIVIDLKKDANAQVVLNRLYQYTKLQDTVGVIMLALDNGIPRIMTLKEMLEKYIRFQDEVIRRRTQFDLKKAQDRAHILEGLKRATDIVDEIIATIRSCKGGKPEAKAAIMQAFEFDDPQATAIVNFQLGQLAGLEILKIENELSELNEKIENWVALLADDAKVLALVKQELLDIRQRFGDERRTEIAAVSGEVDIEDLIPEEDCVYTLTHYGYVKRQPADAYHTQRRGGRGISALSRRDEDFVEELFVGSTHDYILFVTNTGRVFRIKGYEVPEGSRQSRGGNIVNILALAEGEKVTSMLKVSRDKDASGYLVMITRNGTIKRTSMAEYQNIRKSGLIAIGLEENDQLAWSRITTGNDQLIVATHNGMAIRFEETDLRPLSRTAHGVRAVMLEKDDYVVGMSIVRPESELLTITENGQGRRTPVEDYRVQFRGGKGIRNYDLEKGAVAGVKVVDPDDDIILISKDGVIIRMHVRDINSQSRYASGVRVMRLAEGDKVVTVARTPHGASEETEEDLDRSDDCAEATAEELTDQQAEDMGL